MQITIANANRRIGSSSRMGIGVFSIGFFLAFRRMPPHAEVLQLEPFCSGASCPLSARLEGRNSCCRYV